jgi:hypothetical protein
MMQIFKAMALTAATAVAATAAAAAQSNAMNGMQNAMSAHTINATMGAQNGSNQTGTVNIKDVTGGVTVTVTLKNEPSGASEPAHIHEGTCAKLNPAPWKPLNNVVGGTSVTTVKGVTVAQLKAAHYAVNVHKSAADLAHYVSCGDL